MFGIGSFRIGRILGIDVEINYSWLVIFLLIAINFTYIFKQEFKLSYPASIVDGAFTTLFFFASVLFHELSHSYIAKRNNLPIKKITLFIFGGVAQMSEEPKSAGVEFRMAIAGPASSVFLATTFAVIYLALHSLLGLGSVLSSPFYLLAEINLVLALFNMAPGFPLDGGRVLRALIWHLSGDIHKATYYASRAGQGMGFILIFAGLMMVFKGFIGGFWWVFIGWFLTQIARSSYQQLVFQESLAGVKVKEIMSPNVLTVPPTVTLEDLVNDYFMKYRFGRFPVSESGQLLGVITLHDIKEVPRESWSQMQAKDIIKTLEQSAEVSPEKDAAKAMIQMARGDLGHLLVVDGGNLVGIITKSDIIGLIRVKTELGT